MWQWFKQRENLSAALVLLIMALIFLWPIWWYRGYYAPADTIRQMTPFVNGVKPHNQLLTDVVQQFLPWFKLSGSLVRQGYWPLWNIYSGGGLPLLANQQSAVFFPLTWLFFILPFALALALTALFKLLAVGWFTFLYLRAIKTPWWIALAGAAAFMFSGFMVVWLLWPHTAVMFALPAGLYLIEKWLTAKKGVWGLGLSAVLMLAIFAGHPETLFHIGIVWLIYGAVRLGQLNQDKIKAIKGGFKFVGYLLLGALLGAAAWWPFLQYLQTSAIWLERTAGANNFYVPKLLFVANWLPDIFGNPAWNFYFGHSLNYNETTAGYIGVLLVMTAIYAAIWHWRDNFVALFAGLTLASWAVVYKVPLIFNIITWLPGFRSGANQRLLFVAAFGVVVVGCKGLQYLAADKNARRNLMIVAVCLLTAVGLFFIVNYKRSSALTPVAHQWLLGVLLVFVGALILSLIILTVSRGRTRIILIVAVIFLETAAHGSFYNTVTAKQDFYPETGATNYLRQAFAEDQQRVLPLGGVLPPNLGTWYGFDQVNEYDAVGLQSAQNLKSQIGQVKTTWEKFNLPINWSMAQFVGVAYVAAPLAQASALQAEKQTKLLEVYRDDQIIIFKQSALPRAYLVSAGDLTTPEELTAKVLVDLPSHRVADFKLSQDGTENIVYKADQARVLVLNDNYYKGWLASIDGQPATLKQWQGLRVLSVPAGEHKIKVWYSPLSFKIGLALSAVGLLLGLIVFLKERQ